eukprot:TRINITY_DN19667_c0_g1_i2.p2 TRINITY_DN19667_c0_g1~~TRINITY_DN19667_c0_g1_i2.p2  ORF type:complete len:246 (-),score=59.99 TRINITY_DN19667_c0_g1_i2:325-1062(-)
MASAYPAPASSKRVPPRPLQETTGAITEDGRVFTMTPTKQLSSEPLQFDYERELSPSFTAGCAAKEEHRLLLAAKLGHKLCEAEVRKRAETCSVDVSGVVHNAEALKPATLLESIPRAKKFHQKKEFRRKASEAMSPPLSPVLSVDEQGHVEVPDDLLPLTRAFSRQCSIDSDGVLHDPVNVIPPSPQDKNNRLKCFHRKLAARKGEHAELENNTVVSVDAAGCVHESWQMDRTPLIVPLAVSAF